MGYTGDSHPKKEYDEDGKLIDPEDLLIDKIMLMFKGYPKDYQKDGKFIFYKTSEEDFLNKRRGKKEEIWNKGKLKREVFYSRTGKIIKTIEY